MRLLSRSLTTAGSALALAVVLAGGEALVAPTIGEGAAPCRVRNVTQGTRGNSLIHMVRRSHDGDKLVMRGTCRGEVVIETDIVIEGKGRLVPIITGRGRSRAVWVGRGARVTLRRLRIQHGDTDGKGGGIHNAGRLRLRGVIVRGNDAGSGGDGIWNRPKARLAVIESRVIGNDGDGIDNHEGILAVIDSTISGNQGDGIETRGNTHDRKAGRARIRGSIIRSNFGGLTNTKHGRVTITDSAIHGNTLRGGIRISATSVVTLTDSSVTGNSSDLSGGGIRANGTATLVRTTVSGNSTDFAGGGIRVGASDIGAPHPQRWSGELHLIDSEVSGNTAGTVGGGIYAVHASERAIGEVTLQGTSSVHDNVPDDCVGTAAC